MSTSETGSSQSIGRPWAAWLLGALLLGLLALGLWFLREKFTAVEQPPAVDAGPVTQTTTVSAPVAETPPPPKPTEAALLRELGLHGSKAFHALLQTPDLIQRLTAAVWLIAAGRSPRPVLEFLEIDGPFSVRETENGVFISPKSYRRYDALIRALTSVRPETAAEAYTALRPYFLYAFRQVAQKNEHFDHVLLRAIRRLTAVAVPEGPIELIPVGVVYAFQDAKLENLSAAEKHLVRLGPQNAKKVQQFLRKFAAAAAIE